jgi:hypothetical protein
MKYCSKCKKDLSIEMFGKDRYQSDGLTLNCKPCRRSYSKLHYKNNKETVSKKSKLNYEKNKDFYKQKQKAWSQENREKNALRAKRWRENNPDRAKEVSRLGSHRRRARIAGGISSKYSEEQIISKYGTKCHICFEEIDFSASRRSGDKGWEKSFHIDHLIEISLGGNDTLENVRPSHGVCNIRRRRSRKL